MSDAELNLVAWMRAQGMHDSASLVERLTAEQDALRAELAAERENNKSLNKHSTRARGNTQKMKAERDALRAQRNEAMAAVSRAVDMKIEAEAERDALRAQLDAEQETFVDAHGTTWLRPTAEAYYLVCKARDKHQSELAKERERADAHYRALENVTTKNERLTAERDALRAELAAMKTLAYDRLLQVEAAEAERDKLREQYEDAIAANMRLAYELAAERLKGQMQDRNNAERDALRALLRECRSGWYLNEELNARIAAALKGDGEG